MNIGRALLLLPLMGFSSSCGIGGGATVPFEETEAAIYLARQPKMVRSIELPTDSRGGQAPDGPVPVQSKWKLVRSMKGVHSFDTKLPVRPRSFFYSSAPSGMRVSHDGKALKFGKYGAAPTKAASWSFNQNNLRVRLKTKKAPKPGEIVVRYAQAAKRERALNKQWFEGGDKAFVFRSFQQGDTNRYGAFIPAPGRVTWRVEIPVNGRFSTEAGMLEPEMANLDASDGASLSLWVTADNEETKRVDSIAVEPGVFNRWEVDLSKWAGKTVELTLATDPGATAIFDYVLAGSPVIYTPSKSPPRLYLVFIDTLRRDHLGIYGYERDTSPNIDAFAAKAGVFDQARSVAPWTLPSTRSVLTGNVPELWGERPTLPALLAAQGWATGAFIANVYLSSNFDMHKQWGQYTGINWALAGEQIERTMKFVDQYPERPVAVMVHLMDAHLPYNEPVHLRSLFATADPPPLKEGFLRSQVMKLNGPGNEEARQYVIDRYDSSIRYIDNELERLFDEVGPNDTVVIWSDHGEEFWEHGSFEHGHTLYDELLRVPLIVKAPRLAASRSDAPVSLMDVVPTVLEALKVSHSTQIEGASLVPTMRGDKASSDALRARDQSFGRPLYGTEQWGVLSNGMKYISDAGWESVYDLTTDPGETSDLVETGGQEPLVNLRSRMGEAIDRPTREVIRIYPARQRASKKLTVVLTVPGGVKTAWVGNDATLRSEASVKVDGDVVTAVWAGGKTGSREVFIEPNGDWPAVLEGLKIDVTAGKAQASLDSVKESVKTAAPDGRPHDLFDLRLGGREIAVNFGVLPGPIVKGKAVEGFNKENEAALRALGYVD